MKTRCKAGATAQSGSGSAQTERKPAPQAPASGGALADALRRAAMAGGKDSGKDKGSRK